jgi:predicted enzyme related to lactoylglutathione lyase
MANRVVHFEIEAKDANRAKKFYSSAFGWEMEQMGGDYGNYIVVKTGDPMEPMGINGGIYQAGDKKEVNAYRCVVSVEDVQKAMSAVTAAGGKVLSEKPDDILNVGLYVKCEDTEGNLFTLLQPSPNMMPKS